MELAKIIEHKSLSKGAIRKVEKAVQVLDDALLAVAMEDGKDGKNFTGLRVQLMDAMGSINSELWNARGIN